MTLLQIDAKEFALFVCDRLHAMISQRRNHFRRASSWQAIHLSITIRWVVVEIVRIEECKLFRGGRSGRNRLTYRATDRGGLCHRRYRWNWRDGVFAGQSGVWAQWRLAAATHSKHTRITHWRARFNVHYWHCQLLRGLLTK